MPAAPFTCPECDVALRGAENIPPGKKVKCPSCAAVFLMPERKPKQAEVGIRDKPSPSAPTRALRDEIDQESPRPKRRKREEDVEEVEEVEEVDEVRPAKRKRRVRAAEDDADLVTEEYREDEEEEDRPRKKRLKKKKAKRRSSKAALIVILSSVLVVLLGGGGLAAYFIWWHGVNWGSGNEEPWVFAPADANFIVGGDVAAVLNDPAIGSQLDQLLKKSIHSDSSDGLFARILKESGLEFKELASQVVVATTIVPPAGGNPRGGGGAANQPRVTVIMKASKSFNQKKIAAALKDPKTNKEPEQKKRNGKIYYEVVEGLSSSSVFTPSNRTLVVTTKTEAELDGILGASNDKPAVSAETAALIQGVNKHTAWLVMPLDANVRLQMQQGMAMMPPAMKPIADAMGQAKSLVAWASLDANTLKLGASVTCADANAASTLAKEAEGTRGVQKDAMGMLELVLGQLPKTKQAIQESVESTAYKAEGAVMTQTAQISRQTLNEAVKEVQNFAGNLPGGGGQRGGGVGPGVGQPGGGRGGMKGGGKGGGGRRGGGGLRGGKAN